MTKRIYWIPVNGPHTVEKTETPPSLEVMQAYVEGSIEVVNVLFKEGSHQMIVNDEGRIHHMPINAKGTSLYHANSLQKGDIIDWLIHGPVIFLEEIRLD